MNAVFVLDERETLRGIKGLCVFIRDINYTESEKLGLVKEGRWVKKYIFYISIHEFKRLLMRFYYGLGRE